MDMLDDVGALGYNNKIKKAVSTENIFAASYAVHDFQGWVVKDLLKLDDKWDNSDQFKTYSELSGEYDKKGFPDFTDKITQLDFKGLNDLTYVMENKLFETPKLSKIPNFSSVSELRVFLGRSTFDN